MEEDFFSMLVHIILRSRIRVITIPVLLPHGSLLHSLSSSYSQYVDTVNEQIEEERISKTRHFTLLPGNLITNPTHSQHSKWQLGIQNQNSGHRPQVQILLPPRASEWCIKTQNGNIKSQMQPQLSLPWNVTPAPPRTVERQPHTPFVKTMGTVPITPSPQSPSTSMNESSEPRKGNTQNPA